MCLFHQYLSDAVRTTLGQASALLTVDGEDNKEDKTREEADMTLAPFFKSVQTGSNVIQKMGNGQKHMKYGFGPL